MRPDPPDLPARLEPAQTLDGEGLHEAALSDVEFPLLNAPSLSIDACVLDGVRGAATLRGVSMSWADVLANAGVFAAACGVRVAGT